ncbi:type IV secretion system protein [Massilia sp. BJB1822]|uniref:type IV secretion system protein n=1 Tax=Massilia sp. BJB1822 TaxID=2744470 RepID=UPI0015937726|nr:type IV secretion system protein [Massilia sp. BJB1822]NVE00159.1 type IV secretion system protein [Massilia sp. BJB1822]
MPFEVFQTVSVRILEFAADAKTISGNFVTMVIPILQAGLALQIVLHGYRIIRGEGGQHHMLDVFSRSLRAFLVFSMALAAGAYEDNVHQLILGLGNDALVGFGGQPGLNKYQQVDAAMQAGFDAFDKIVAWGHDHIGIGFIYIDISGIWAILAGAVMILIILFLGVIACAELLVVDFALAIIFGIGPLFVACYAFEATARFFDTWLSGVLKWLFTAVVITITVLLAVKVLQRFTSEITEPSNLNQILLVILSASAATVVLIMIVLRAPTIATDLVGGIGLNSMAGRVGSAISNTLKGAAKGGISGAMKGGEGGKKGAIMGAFGMSPNRTWKGEESGRKPGSDSEKDGAAGGGNGPGGGGGGGGPGGAAVRSAEANNPQGRPRASGGTTG